MNEDEHLPENESTTPADALSRTPEDLEQEQAAAHTEALQSAAPTQKKQSALRRVLRKINVYLLLLLLIVVVTAAVTVVNYLNSKKDPVAPAINSQELSKEALEKLANTDTSVGDSSQTLTIKGNAVIDGQTLMRGNLNVAGNFQSAGSMQGSSLTISGTSNLATAQINSLQVASDLAVQGNATASNITIAGTASFGGAVTAPQITVSKLVLSGNGSIDIPNHLSFTGPNPNRSINGGPLGGGGSASVSGSDTSGTVNISTGNNPSAGCMVRISFAQRFTTQPRVIVSPVGNAAGRTQYYVDRDQTGFSICTAAPAPGNQSFAFDYFVAG